MTITLESIEPVSIKKGFYEIEYDFHPAANVSKTDLRLYISRTPIQSGKPVRASPETITRMPHINFSGGLDLAALKLMLLRIKHLNLWGEDATAHLVSVTRDRTGRPNITLSNPCEFSCPIKPVFGCNVSPGSISEFGKLVANDDISYGEPSSLLARLDLFGEQILLFHANQLAVGKRDRLLDCITFADSALGLGSMNVYKKTGAYIAESANAVSVIRDGVTSQFQQYFDDTKKDDWEDNTYVFWWSGSESGHVVLIEDGTVCEYSQSEGGYLETAVGKYFRTHKFISLKGNLSKVP